MKVIDQYFEVKSQIEGLRILRQIEQVSRTCYKSENKITEDSAAEFVRMLIDRGHEAMLEHESISVKFITDRGVSHEIVRHRIASYAQESTRYCNYGIERFENTLTFIKPCFTELNSSQYLIWESTCRLIELNYFTLLQEGWKPEEARSILPNSLKTEIVVTMNLREWRHLLNLRTAKTAHPQMRDLLIPLLNHFKSVIPIIFDDIMI